MKWIVIILILSILTFPLVFSIVRAVNEPKMERARAEERLNLIKEILK